MVYPIKTWPGCGGAAVLLIAVILPAEYGIDPTGFGRLAGISSLSEKAPAPARDFGQTMVFNIEEYDPTAEQIEQSIRGLIHLEEKPFLTETIDLKIEDFGKSNTSLSCQQTPPYFTLGRCWTPKAMGFTLNFTVIHPVPMRRTIQKVLNKPTVRVKALRKVDRSPLLSWLPRLVPHES